MVPAAKCGDIGHWGGSHGFVPIIIYDLTNSDFDIPEGPESGVELIGFESSSFLFCQCKINLRLRAFPEGEIVCK